MSLLRPATIERLQRRVAPQIEDELVAIGEVWRMPGSQGAPVAGGAGVDKYGTRVSEGTAPSRPDQKRAFHASYPVRINRNGSGGEREFGAQMVSVAPWSLIFNWADNPDVRSGDRILIARAAWTPSTPLLVGAIVQPTASNGRYYVVTIAGTTGATEPTWPLNPKGATVASGTATLKYADYLRSFEVKDAGGETTFKIVRIVGCEEIIYDGGKA